MWVAGEAGEGVSQSRAGRGGRLQLRVDAWGPSEHPLDTTYAAAMVSLTRTEIPQARSLSSGTSSQLPDTQQVLSKQSLKDENLWPMPGLRESERRRESGALIAPRTAVAVDGLLV